MSVNVVHLMRKKSAESQMLVLRHSGLKEQKETIWKKKISLTGGGVRMKVPFFDAHKSLWHCSLITLKTIKINYNGIFFAFNLLVLS